MDFVLAVDACVIVNGWMLTRHVKRMASWCKLGRCLLVLKTHHGCPFCTEEKV